MTDISRLDATLARDYTSQAILWGALSRAEAGYSVISGLKVEQRNAGANMSVDVDDGYCLLNWVKTTISGPTHTNVVIEAADVSPRIDLLYINGSGVLTVLKGTAATIAPVGATDWHKYEAPYPPSLAGTAGVPLALIRVAGSATTIVDADIWMIGVIGRDLATTVSSPGSDSSIPSEQAVREGLDGLINGATSDTGTPEGASDYLLIYDNTNSAHRKVSLNTLAKRREPVSIGSPSMWPSTTNGATAAAKTEASTNKQNYQGAAFVHTGTTYLEFGFALPNKYDGGSITARFFWYQAGTSTNGVRWGLQGRSYGDNETIDQSWGTAQEVTDNGTSTAGRILISDETPAITLAGTPDGGEWVMIRVYRNPAHAGDTLDATVYLLGVQLFVGIDAWSD